VRRPDLIAKEELTAEAGEILKEFLAAGKGGEPVEGR
jgi:hypothetical protein